MPSRPTLRYALLAALVLTLAALGFVAHSVASTANAVAAKTLCSDVFLSRRTPQAVIEQDLRPDNPLAPLQRFSVETASASVSLLGLWTRRAIHRPGLSCTLLNGVTEAALRAQPLPEPAPPPQPETPLPPSNIDGILQMAFEEPGGAHALRTRAVVVMRDGQFIAERYAPGFHRDMPLLSWSMAKSITNALLALRTANGALDIRRPAAVPEWASASDPRHAITPEQLLRMSSGLAFRETRTALPADALNMLFRQPDAGAYAADMPLEAAPGTQWQYSSGTTNILSRLLRDTFHGDLQAYWNFPRQALFDPIGARHMMLEVDPSGTFVGSSFAYATARDWARLGQLFLDDGMVQGRRLLPEGWTRFATTPAPAAPHGSYGAHVWLNRGSENERQWPLLPDDTYSFQGYEGQLVIIVPTYHLVMVRMGLTRTGATWDPNRYLPSILAALE
ncbi:serine hydrolase domain-containing protein [Paludibaculum fermentans]|uniref:Serine hydrolase n=1 Tax=Paludibaculum fermentans TaxID=1473598 RepID=A0A7S7NUJ9_PALFE|nr:serine hydrolase [Paludibaculum fermentans]QOY89996.1 serine hydrolase [Paludibaculum fermentans]